MKGRLLKSSQLSCPSSPLTSPGTHSLYLIFLLDPLCSLYQELSTWLSPATTIPS